MCEVFLERMDLSFNVIIAEFLTRQENFAIPPKTIPKPSLARGLPVRQHQEKNNLIYFTNSAQTILNLKFNYQTAELQLTVLRENIATLKSPYNTLDDVVRM